MSNPAFPGNLAALFEARVPYRRHDRDIRLRVPRTGDVWHLIVDPNKRTAQADALALAIEASHLVRTIDGRPLLLPEARGLVRDPEAGGALFAARNALYEVLSERGCIWMLCPVCRRGEVELDLLGIGLRLDAVPWPVVAPDRLMLAPPSLAEMRPAGARPPGVPRTARVRFSLPSARLSLWTESAGSVLGDLDGGREAAAWTAWTATDQPLDDREDWTPDNPGFRAMLRLAVALAHLDGVDDAISPETIERLPVIDAYFLDTLYYFTHTVDVRDPLRAAITCDACGCSFLPVR